MFNFDKEDILIVTQIIANMLRMYGVILIIPIIVSLFYGELSYTKIFLITGVVITVGCSILRRVIKTQACDVKHALISLALIWVIISLASIVPFLHYGISFLNAFFETTSAWSGTGFTMIQDPSVLPHSLQFFRGFIQWLGGFGVVILVLILYEKPKTAYVLFLAEGRFEHFSTDFMKIARIIVGIYAVYTAIGVFCMWISGVPFFDALVNIMDIMATGGLSTNSVGIGFYGRIPMLIAMVFMYIGGTSFLSHYALIKGRVAKFFKNPEIRYMFAIFAVGSLIICLDLYFNKKYEYYHGIFYALSALTTTGTGSTFTVANFPPASLLILMILMISGPAYGSTGGGIKIWRSIIILKVIRREILKPFLHPNAIIPLKIGNNVVDDETASKVASFVIIYIFFILVGSVIFMFFNYDLKDSIFTVASAQANGGLLTISGTAWFGMHAFLKVMLILHMLIGRVEIFPFFILLKALMGRR